jgi:hypothetical protein
MRIDLKGIRINDSVFLDLILYVVESEEKDIITIEAKFDNSVVKVEEEYYFTALQELRKQLFKKEVEICCYGAKKNIYPSPMMMNSLNAYSLTIGKQAKAEDIVGIFDSCELDEITTVEDQNMFYQEWIRSLKHDE